MLNSKNGPDLWSGVWQVADTKTVQGYFKIKSTMSMDTGMFNILELDIDKQCKVQHISCWSD